MTFCWNLISGHQIATNFCICHDSCAVMTCAKFYCNHLTTTWHNIKRLHLDLNFEWQVVSDNGCLATLVISCTWHHVSTHGLSLEDSQAREIVSNHHRLNAQAAQQIMGCNNLETISVQISGIVGVQYLLFTASFHLFTQWVRKLEPCGPPYISWSVFF